MLNVENVGPVHIQETITVSILLDEGEDPDILSDVIEEILKPLPEPDPLRDLQILRNTDCMYTRNVIRYSYY